MSLCLQLFHRIVGENTPRFLIEGLIPDTEFCCDIVELFGLHSHVTRKLRRTLYWGRKFKNANPYQLPFHLPDDPIEIAILALKKMVIDVQNEIQVWEVSY